MITRPTLHYESPAQIVRLWHYGFNVPNPVYWYALSQLPVEPPVVYRTVDEEDTDAAAEVERRREANASYDSLHER